MKICQDLYMDELYTFTNEDGEQVQRFLLTFIGEENNRYDIEMDLTDECYFEFVDGHEDITAEDRQRLFYLLDRWAINNII